MTVIEPAADPQIQTLYSDHSRWLRDWLRRRLGCAEQAADIAHDTFVRLLSKPEPVALREPRAFLTTVAGGLLANFRRRQKLEAAYLDALAQLPEPLVPSPELQAAMFETLVEIDRLLDGLPPLVRRAFLLSQLDGMSQAEIAERLRISVPTVKRHVARALVACAFAVQDEP